MNFGTIDIINVILNWDYCGRSRQSGTYEDAYYLETELYNIEFELYFRVEIDKDEGDYWNPPSFDEVDREVVIENIKVSDLEHNEVTLDDHQYNELLNTLSKNIEYE